MSFGLVLPYSMSLLYGSMLWGYRKGSRANFNYEFVGIKRIKCYLPWKICLWCNTAPALHILDRIYELTSVTVVLNYLDFTVFTRLLRYSCPSHWLMSNSIHSTTVSLVGVVSGRSGTTPRWNRRVQFLTPCPRLLHPQPPLWSRPTSLTSDSMSSQPVIPIIKSNLFISQSNPSVHPLSVQYFRMTPSCSSCQGPCSGCLR